MNDLFGKAILAPATDADQSEDFTVDGRSKTFYIAPSSGTTFTEEASCVLERKVADAQYIPVIGAAAVTLGSNRTEAEIIARGTFRWNKGATTEAVGIYEILGMEEVE